MDDEQKVDEIVDYLLGSPNWIQSGEGATFVQFEHHRRSEAEVSVPLTGENDPDQLIDNISAGEGVSRGGMEVAIFGEELDHTPSPSDESPDDSNEPIDTDENTPRGYPEGYPPSEEEISAYLEGSDGWAYDKAHSMNQRESSGEMWGYNDWCASAILFPSGNERLREKSLYRMAAVEVRHPDEILEEMWEAADEVVSFQELCRFFEEEYGQSFRANLLHCVRANPRVPPEDVVAEECSNFAGEFGVILDEPPSWYRLMTEAVVELYCRSD